MDIVTKALAVALLISESLFVVAGTQSNTYIEIPNADVVYYEKGIGERYDGKPIAVSRNWNHDFGTGLVRSSVTVFLCLFVLLPRGTIAAGTAKDMTSGTQR